MSFLEYGAIRIKVCGITNEADARMCISTGADALGFNFFPKSKRYVEPDQAIPWIKELEGLIDRVAVVVNPDQGLLEKLRAAECFEMIQFHGDESPAFCEEAGFPVWIRAVRVRDRESLQGALAYHTPNLLFDSWTTGEYGGTGKRFDWEIARDFAAEHSGHRIILAGGLNTSHVSRALQLVHPFAVDVAGGVESSPGVKSEGLVKEFIAAVRNEFDKLASSRQARLHGGS